MKAEDVLKQLEKHEEECNRRYADIQEKLKNLDKQGRTRKRLTYEKPK